MQLTLPRPIDWGWIFRALGWSAIAVVLAYSIAAAIPKTQILLSGTVGWDWVVYTRAGELITSGESPYGTLHGFRYSPLVAYFFAAIEPIGWLGWTAIGFATVAVLRDWRIIAVLLLLAPFWSEMRSGMSFLPTFVLAVCAIRGERWATIGLVAMTILIPRPMQIPILAWLLWRDRDLPIPSALVAAALVIATLLTGWMDEWIAALTTIAGQTAGIPLSTMLGPIWLILPVIGVWLTLRGHLGWAALAVSPYIAPAYPMMLLLELRPLMSRRGASGGTAHSR